MSPATVAAGVAATVFLVCLTVVIRLCIRNPFIAPADEPVAEDGEWCDCDTCVRIVSILQARARADATPEEIARADLLLWEIERSPAQ